MKLVWLVHTGLPVYRRRSSRYLSPYSRNFNALKRRERRREKRRTRLAVAKLYILFFIFYKREKIIYILPGLYYLRVRRLRLNREERIQDVQVVDLSYAALLLLQIGVLHELVNRADLTVKREKLVPYASHALLYRHPGRLVSLRLDPLLVDRLPNGILKGLGTFYFFTVNVLVDTSRFARALSISTDLEVVSIVHDILRAQF